MRKFATGPRALSKIANGDTTGFAFLPIKELQLFDDFFSVTPESVAATMSNIPGIEKSSAKRKTNATSNLSDTKKKKGQSGYSQLAREGGTQHEPGGKEG